MDPSRRIEIGHSPAKVFGLIALGAAMTGLSAALAWPLEEELGGFFLVVAIVSAVFFGLSTGVMVWRALTMGAAVTLAPEGLRDARLAAEFIPWGAIEKVSMYTILGESFVIVAVAPELEKRLKLAAITRWTRGANRAIGADGLPIGAQGLAIDCATLQAAIEVRVAAARSR